MLSEHVSNLSVEVKKLSDYVDQQSKNLAELVCLFQLPLIFFSKRLYILSIIYLSIYLFIYLSIYLFIYLFALNTGRESD